MVRRSSPFLWLAAAAAGLALSAHAAAPTKFSGNAAEVRDFIAVSSTVGYAGTNGGGAWKSSDAGLNWSKTTLGARNVWKIAANPNSAGARLYAATEQGLFRSIDSGATWTQLTQDPTHAVAVDPTSAAGGPDTVLAGVPGVGVIKTSDSGATFARVSTGLDSVDVLGLVYYPGSATTAFVVLQCNVDDAPAQLSGNWGGVYRTTNANAVTPSWTVFNSGLPNVDQVSAPCANAIAANGTNVVVGIKDYSTMQGGTYFITTAGAITWTASASNPQPFGVEFLGPDFTNTSGFFLGSNQFGPYRSTNGGNNFTQISSGVDPEFTALGYAAGAFAATTWVAGINGVGLFRTTTGASPWNLPTTPIKADRVNDLTNHSVGLPNTYYMALKNGGAMKSTDTGANWVQFDAGLGTVYASVTSNFVRDVEVIAAHPNNGNVVALGMRAFGLYQLSGGTTWVQVSGFTNGVDHKPQSVVITPGGTVHYTLFDAGAATPGGHFRATATGTTIGSLASTGKPIFEANPGLGVAPAAGRVRPMPSAPESKVYMTMYDSLPYRSADGGQTWARVNVPANGMRELGFQRLAFFDVAEKPANTAVLLAPTNKGIYRSTDSGVNWSWLATSGLSQPLMALVYSTSNVAFGGDAGGQLYCSGDDGANWQAVTGGNLGSPIRDIKVMSGTIHVLTDGAGFWKKDNTCP